MIVPRWPRRRAVVTGLGVVSPIGNTKEKFWQGLVDGQSGISHIETPSGDATCCAGAVKDFRGDAQDFDHVDKELRKPIRKSLKMMNRATQMAVAAAQQAIGDSGLATADVDRERVGVCLGAQVISMLPEHFLVAIRNCTNSEKSFDFSRWGTDGIPHVAPLWLLTCLPNMPACQIAVLNDLRGPNNSITQREASANLAIAEAWNLIAEDQVDFAIAGATGSTILPMNMVHELIETEVAPGAADPTKVCRPFDRHRNGTVLGEGAAVIVLEELSSAIRRKVHIYGEVLGYGSSYVARRSDPFPSARAMANAMRGALGSSRAEPSDIGHIHAHGLSTRRSDIDESRAIIEVFGSRRNRMPVVAAKSYDGNAGAGSGAMELVASLLALGHGRLFPVLNYDTPDEECPVAAVTSAGTEAGESFLNLSAVGNGCASCLLVGAFR